MVLNVMTLYNVYTYEWAKCPRNFLFTVEIKTPNSLHKLNLSYIFALLYVQERCIL